MAAVKSTDVNSVEVEDLEILEVYPGGAPGHAGNI